MACTNSYDTITQADGIALPNEFAVPAITLTTGGHVQPTVTSYCRTTDGTWVAWFQNNRGDGIDTAQSVAYGPDQNKGDWPSLVANATPIGVGYFADDGSDPVVYELGLEWPCFGWTTVPTYSGADPCSYLFPIGTNFANDQRSQMNSWSTQVLDVQVRTDGVNVWVVVLARETVDYPYLYGPGGDDRCGIFHLDLISELSTESHDPFNHDTDSGRRWWQHFGGSTPDDPGPSNSFRWQPARVTVWAGDIGGFTKLPDTVDATFNNYSATGLCSGIECAAAPAEPGVLHVLWAEGGTFDTFSTLVGQRINYSSWDTAGKIVDNDVLYADEPNTGGYNSDDNFVWTAEMIVRNDHGSPIAVVWPWVMDGGPVNVSSTAQFWDLSAGTANVIQTMSPALAPTAAEAETSDTPVVQGQILTEPLVPRRSQFASSLYTDPLLTNTDVYLICVAYDGDARAFYRIPCDGSDTFDYLDGLRLSMYSIIPANAVSNASLAPFVSDFVSDPEDVWMPAENSNIGGAVLRLDRQCQRGWQLLPAWPVVNPSIGKESADWSVDENGVSPPTILTLDDGDWLAGGGLAAPLPLFAADPVSIASIRAKICRCCLPCNRTGMHVWEIL